MKNIIIIGPANYLLKKENKNFIDSFDQVIRINQVFLYLKN